MYSYQCYFSRSLHYLVNGEGLPPHSTGGRHMRRGGTCVAAIFFYLFLLVIATNNVCIVEIEFVEQTLLMYVLKSCMKPGCALQIGMVTLSSLVDAAAVEVRKLN